MRYPITLYLGSAATIQHHWIRRLRQLSQAQTDASVVIVPTSSLAVPLRERLIGTPNILSLDQFLEEILPQNITRMPEGTWDVLSLNVPPDLLPSPLRDTPGVARAVLEVIRWGRALGIRDVTSSHHDRLDWSALWHWIDRVLQGPLVDELRMYEYAIESTRVPVLSEGRMMLYGFSSITPPLWTLLSHWSTMRPLEAWAIEALMSADEVQRWQSLGATLQEYPDFSEGGGTNPRRILVEGEANLIEASAHLIKERHLAPNAWVILDPEPSRRKAVIRALVRAGLVEEHHLYRSEPAALWSLFLRVASGSHGPERSRWLAVIGAQTSEERHNACSWAERWWQMAKQCQAWADVHGLVMKAVQFHHREGDWAALLTWVKSWAVWDNLPATYHPDIDVAAALQNQGWAANGTGKVPVMLPEEGIWMPSSVYVVLDVGTGHFPRARPRNPLWMEDAVNDWASRIYPGGVQDEALIEALLNTSAIDSIWIRQTATSDWPERLNPGFDPEPYVPPCETGLPPSLDAIEPIELWYRNWRESSGYQENTGQINPELVSRLLPEELSPSALESFGRCPLNFLYERLLRIPATAEESAEVSASLSGQWAHRALEILLHHEQGLSPEDIKRAVARAIVECPPPHTIASFHIRYHEKRLASELYEALMRDERRTLVRQSYLEVALHWSSLWPMRGRVDRVDFLNDQTIRLIDYKTGHVANPNRPAPNNLQLSLYQDALSEKYGQTVHAELMGISQRTEFSRKVLDPDADGSRRTKILTILEGIKQRMDKGQFFPVPDARINPCRMCAFRLVCPARVADYAASKIAGDPEFQSLWREEGANDATD